MVQKHGIDYEEKKHNQLFCINSSKDILNMLIDECTELGVQIHMDVETEKVVKKHEEGNESHYSVTSIFNSKVSSNKTRLECKSLIVATGALSIPTLGGSGFGYELAQEFQLPLVPRRASLVPFMWFICTCGYYE